MDRAEILKYRAETPGCQYVTHLNNAGAALMPTPVLDAYQAYLKLEADIGGYEAANASAHQLQQFYQSVAKLINCKPTEIAFAESATRAWDMIFYSFKFKEGDIILTANAEYGSNFLAFLQTARKYGIKIKVIPDDEFGQLDLTMLEQMINPKVKLIAITHIPTQGGLINPAEAVGQIAKENNIPYLLDTTQSLGQMPINVEEIGCDFLCGTGRKFLRGPRGTGFLFVKEQKIQDLEPPFIDLHAATWVTDDDYTLNKNATRFESWEQNYAGKRALTVAIDYALQIKLENIWQRIQFLSQLMREMLNENSSILLKDLGKEKCGIITFSHQSLTTTYIQEKLATKKINVSLSFQEYARLDLSRRNIQSLVRASVHYYNTEDEILELTKTLTEL